MAATWLYTTLLISVCSFCRGQHADVTFGQFWFSALIAILKTPSGASLLILGYDATASSNAGHTDDQLVPLAAGVLSPKAVVSGHYSNP